VYFDALNRRNHEETDRETCEADGSYVTSVHGNYAGSEQCSLARVFANKFVNKI
jgi:hypothetical protein